MKFVFGFEYNGILYGWNKKELYKIPSLRKLNQIMIGNQVGYRLSGKRIKISDLEPITIKINIDTRYCPF